MPRSIRVRDYMSAHLVTFTPDMEILEAVHLLVRNRISGGPVLDLRGNLIGMLSESDCVRVALNAAYHSEWGGRVEEFMAREIKTVDADASIVDVAAIFVDSGYRRLPVVEGNRLVGQISRHDILRAMEILR
ncbi:MAG: CBS domain-containing protein [Gammaproteobacteria bacterium]|nr:CBS domain-containing protein [Gammaproteobacteria bacterium]